MQYPLLWKVIEEEGLLDDFLPREPSRLIDLETPSQQLFHILGHLHPLIQELQWDVLDVLR
jgi:hypothetical protein